MSFGMNHVSLAGVVEKPPKVFNVNSGGRKAYFSVVVRRLVVDKTGAAKEYTDYVDCHAWGRVAEQAEHIQPGTVVAVEGQLRSEKSNKDGVEYWKMVVNVSTVSTYTGGSRAPIDDEGQWENSPPAEPQASPSRSAQSQIEYGPGGIPF